MILSFLTEDWPSFSGIRSSGKKTPRSRDGCQDGQDDPDDDDDPGQHTGHMRRVESGKCRHWRILDPRIECPAHPSTEKEVT